MEKKIEEIILKDQLELLIEHNMVTPEALLKLSKEFSAQQNKHVIEELETERKLGLKLNSDYTDLNTRLSAELSQQKELVEKKDATIEGYKNNTAHLYDQISTLKQEIEALKKERDKYYDLWFEGKYPKFSEQANNATTEPKEEKEDRSKWSCGDPMVCLRGCKVSDGSCKHLRKGNIE